MPLIIPPNFSPYADILSFLESPYSSQFSSPQLVYQNRLEAPISRPKQAANNQVRPSSLIASSDSLDTDLLDAFNYLDENIKLGVIEDKLASETTVNKAFLHKNLLFVQISNQTPISAPKQTPVLTLMILTLMILTLITKILCNTPVATSILIVVIVVMLQRN